MGDNNEQRPVFKPVCKEWLLGRCTSEECNPSTHKLEDKHLCWSIPRSDIARIRTLLHTPGRPAHCERFYSGRACEKGCRYLHLFRKGDLAPSLLQALEPASVSGSYPPLVESPQPPRREVSDDLSDSSERLHQLEREVKELCLARERDQKERVLRLELMVIFLIIVIATMAISFLFGGK